MSQSDEALRLELIEACRAMNRLGITRGTSGNISVRSGDGFLISPTGIAYDDLRPNLIVHVRMDGTFAGDVLPSSEWRFHRDILQHRSELNAVVHTHSIRATAMAIMGLHIPAIHYSIAAVGGPDIRCARYATFGSEELAEAALEALQGRRACLLAHHGVIAAHGTIARALSLAVLVEELATQYLLCRGFGEPPVLDDAEIDRVLQKYTSYGQQRASAG
jgi:L-fuculose-phosphate aldolase